MGLDFKGIQPFVVFAGGFEIRSQQRREFAGGVGLPGISNLLDQKQKKLGLVGKLLC